VGGHRHLAYEELIARGLSRGEHACLAGTSDGARRRAVAAVVGHALDDGDHVLLLTCCEPRLRELEIREDLGDRAPAALWYGQLAALPALPAYAPRGRFDRRAMIARVSDLAYQALLDGWSGLTVVGEMRWASDGVPGSEDLAAYEIDVDRLFAQLPIRCLCVYDPTGFPEGRLEDALSAHRIRVGAS
jgi:hypothetical protein